MRKIVSGTLETIFMPLSNGDEIDIEAFVVSRSNLEKAGFESGDQFFDYIMSCPPKTVVGRYIPDSPDGEGLIKARDFQRRDGYNTLLKVGGCIYHYY